MESNEQTNPRTLYRTAMRTCVGVLAVSLLVGGCATQTASTTDDTASTGDVAAAAASTSPPGAQDATAIVATSFGKGTYSDGGLSTVSFVYDSEVNGAGEMSGYFRHSGSYGDGRIELAGTVTCASYDHAEGRAWIAGSVDRNESTVDFASPATLPPGGMAGFVVEDPSVALIAHIQFPQPLAGNDAKAARAFCDARRWPSEPLYPLNGGTLGVFP